MKYLEYIIELDNLLNHKQFHRVFVPEPIVSRVYIEKSTNRSVLLMFSETKDTAKPITFVVEEIMTKIPETTLLTSISVSVKDYDKIAEMADFITKTFGETK